jgi:nitroimidazol reductase NimA-like FMN-containing flavoprotein (pyridoxamine 5'-phosphate oxidase superfamily)
MPDDSELHGLEVLSPAACLRLLGSGRIGRVGFVSDGQPHVLPVNYVASDAGEVVFRTTDGSVLTAVAGRPATFEIDGYDEQSRTGWSVCVHGLGREITDADDPLARQLRDLDVITWAPGRRDRWFAILGDQLTGRRIPMTVTPADLGWIAGVVS